MGHLARLALIIGAIVLIAGCRGSQTALGAPGELPQSRAKQSWTYDVLYSFSHHHGTHPGAAMVAVNGTLYGTTEGGGRFHRGTVFAVSPNGTETVLHSFGKGVDGQTPEAGLVDVDGALYGTTYSGGANLAGTVFSIDTSGSEKVLYSFSGGADGGYPSANLIVVNGTLYGTTLFGGDDSYCTVKGFPPGCGTVFRISSNGSEQVLHSFKGSPADGAYPRAPLLDVKGTLFGTTVVGGSENSGTVYRISTAGAEQTLYSFEGGKDGAQPEGGLLSVRGKLYGTTFRGGGEGCEDSEYGCGVVYRINARGKERVLHAFTGGADGSGPIGDLVAANGTLYGTTWEGGASCTSALCGPGTIYQISTTGAEEVLYIFNRSDGMNPHAGLTNANGTLYGTTFYGGRACPYHDSGGCGTVFSFSQ